MSPAVLAIVAAVLQLVQGFLPAIPELIGLVKTTIQLMTQTTPITADQEQTYWNGLLAAHVALQAAGGPAADALSGVVSQAPATSTPVPLSA